jgi:hypothetical protein
MNLQEQPEVLITRYILHNNVYFGSWDKGKSYV